MYRVAARRVAATATAQPSHLIRGARRWASTVPADRPRSFKSSLARWGLAIAGVYYYNTSKAFAEEPYATVPLPTTESETEVLPTVEEIAAQRREARQKAPSRQNASATSGAASSTAAGEAAISPESLEEEAEGEGAFNPETGEINWDCPCLGGMAHGPCGPEFREAFSCFVFSNEEPKGMDCIEKFKGMQTCFRAHPDVYGAELEDDEEPDTEHIVNTEAGDALPDKAAEPQARKAKAEVPSEKDSKSLSKEEPPIDEVYDKSRITEKPIESAVTEMKIEHHPKTPEEEALPKEWHDDRQSNQSS